MALHTENSFKFQTWTDDLSKALRCKTKRPNRNM